MLKMLIKQCLLVGYCRAQGTSYTCVFVMLQNMADNFLPPFQEKLSTCRLG